MAGLRLVPAGFGWAVQWCGKSWLGTCLSGVLWKARCSEKAEGAVRSRGETLNHQAGRDPGSARRGTVRQGLARLGMASPGLVVRGSGKAWHGGSRRVAVRLGFMGDGCDGCTALLHSV